MQFPLDENVVWRATEPGSGRVSAITEIEGEKDFHFSFTVGREIFNFRFSLTPIL